MNLEVRDLSRVGLILVMFAGAGGMGCKSEHRHEGPHDHERVRGVKSPGASSAGGVRTASVTHDPMDPDELSTLGTSVSLAMQGASASQLTLTIREPVHFGLGWTELTADPADAFDHWSPSSGKSIRWLVKQVAEHLESGGLVVEGLDSGGTASPTSVDVDDVEAMVKDDIITADGHEHLSTTLVSVQPGAVPQNCSASGPIHAIFSAPRVLATLTVDFDEAISCGAEQCQVRVSFPGLGGPGLGLYQKTEGTWEEVCRTSELPPGTPQEVIGAVEINSPP